METFYNELSRVNNKHKTKGYFITPMKELRKFLVTTLIGGVTIILPFTLFILAARIVFRFILSAVTPISKLIPISAIENQHLLNLIAFGILLVFCFSLGLTVRTRAGSAFFNYIEKNVFFHLPFYKIIKETVSQFTGRSEIPFKRVVLVDAFGSGTKMIGFVADEHKDGDLTVFVPTGPNPTNGFIFHLHPKQVEFTDLKPEDAMRTIIGVGIGAKKHF